MKEIFRILDANFNRAREALRVAEDCGRFVLNDPAVTAMAKTMRSDLRGVLERMPTEEFLASRDTAGDLGTELSSPLEPVRQGLEGVVAAACKRLSEALRTIEEYSKIVSPSSVLEIQRMRYNGYTLEQRVMQRLAVRQRFRDVKLYALLSSHLCRGSVRETARGAIAGGAEAIQIREKNVPDAQFLALAAELRELTDEMGRILIVNDRADVAAIVGADGVHLGQGDLPIAEVRRLLRPTAIVGRSTHSIEQARAAVNEGADYISVGPMFPTTTKDRAPVGPGLLKEALAEISVPIVCIGGINTGNVGQLVAAGGRCIAVSSVICAAQNPREAAESIRQAIP